MEVDSAIYRSPKRKRAHPTKGPSVVTSGLSRSLSPSDDMPEDIGSPSARVTGKFQKLDIQSLHDLPPPLLDYSPDESSPPPTARPPTPPPPPIITSERSSAPHFKPPESSKFNFTSPITPNTPTPTPTITTSLSPNRSKSPPPSTVVSDQFWHASEITGWSPDDPDEDNYGVNGVGYAKSASKAWSISQKRKQQIADYRSRETREARQRRHEKRLSGFNSRRGSPRGSPRPESVGGCGNGNGEDGRSQGRERKGVRFVHFDDG